MAKQGASNCCRGERKSCRVGVAIVADFADSAPFHCTTDVRYFTQLICNKIIGKDCDKPNYALAELSFIHNLVQ
jgi:hypothetical protein